MLKEKVNYQEVYDLYQLCSETKDLKEFCSEYGVNYDKFMNWQRHQLWDEKLGKTVEVKQPDTAPIQIAGTSGNQQTVKIQPVKPAVQEAHIRRNSPQLPNSWSDMAYLTESLVIDRMQVNKVDGNSIFYEINLLPK